MMTAAMTKASLARLTQFDSNELLFGLWSVVVRKASENLLFKYVLTVCAHRLEAVQATYR